VLFTFETTKCAFYGDDSRNSINIWGRLLKKQKIFRDADSGRLPATILLSEAYITTSMAYPTKIFVRYLLSCSITLLRLLVICKMSDCSVDNEFASTLVFYDRFRRSKLTPSDLSKISKKYARRPKQLIIDLESKYEMKVPNSCLANEVYRICKQYNVPKSYIDLLPQRFRESSFEYDPELDIQSARFHAEKAIASRRIIAPIVNFAPLDNIAKTKYLLPVAGCLKQV
jgi:hypothetical protein